MRSRSLAALAALALAVPLAGCRDTTPAPRVTIFTPPTTGTPRTECVDGSWSTATGPGACSHHGGVRHG